MESYKYESQQPTKSGYNALKLSVLKFCLGMEMN